MEVPRSSPTLTKRLTVVHRCWHPVDYPVSQTLSDEEEWVFSSELTKNLCAQCAGQEKAVVTLTA